MPKLKTHKGAAKRFKKTGNRESEAVEFVPPPHSHLERQEAEAAFARHFARERCRHTQNQADDSLLVRNPRDTAQQQGPYQSAAKSILQRPAREEAFRSC